MNEGIYIALYCVSLYKALYNNMRKVSPQPSPVCSIHHLNNKRETNNNIYDIAKHIF